MELCLLLFCCICFYFSLCFCWCTHVAKTCSSTLGDFAASRWASVSYMQYDDKQGPQVSGAMDNAPKGRQVTEE